MLAVFFITLLLPPVWSILFVFYILYKKRPNNYFPFILSFFLALIAIYWFPWGDNQTHFNFYNTDAVSFYLQSTDYLITSQYWLYDYVIRFFADLFGNYVWGYFFWMFFPLLCFSSLLWKRCNLTTHKKFDQCLILFLIFFIIGERELLDLSRSTTSYLLIISSYMLFEEKHRVLGLILLIISYYLHSTLAPLFLMSILFFIFIKKISSQRTCNLYMLLFLMLSMFANLILPHFLSESMVEKYLQGAFGAEIGVGSGFMRILGWLNVLIMLIIYFFVSKNIKQVKSRLLLSLYLASTSLALLGFNYLIIRERFTIMSIISGMTILLIYHATTSSAIKKLSKVIVPAIICRFVLLLFLHYSALYVHHSSSTDPSATVQITSRIFYVPSLVLFDVDDFGYSDNMYLKLYKRANG